MWVIWSVESKINKHSTNYRKWNWKKVGKPLRAKDFIQPLKPCGGIFKLCGFLTAYGDVPIYKIQGNMNRKIYHNILRTGCC